MFINEGAFIPESIEQALEPGYKPPCYRNVFLCNAMGAVKNIAYKKERSRVHSEFKVFFLCYN